MSSRWYNFFVFFRVLVLNHLIQWAGENASMANEKVLIVDDEPDVLDLCKRILETRGYRVTSAGNGYEAIKIATHTDFDLLLTDIKMPGMTGLEIAQKLKETDPNMVCITMTGYATMDSAIKALSLGIDEFILKPFTPADLLRSISRALEKERLKKENLRLHSLIPLFELNKTLMGTVEVEKVLSRLIEIAQKATQANFAWLYIIKNGTLTVGFHCHDGCDDTEAQREASKKLAESIFKDGNQITLLRQDKNNQYHQSIIEQLGAASVIATPLKSQMSNLGALVLAHIENKFAPSDSDFLSVLCGQASIALENAEAYQQLQMLDHMKSEFINIAAHELRTPLAIILGYTSILEEDVDAPQQEFVDSIMRNALRLRTLMDDMLNLKKLENGIVSISHDKVNLRDTVQTIIQDLSLFEEEKYHFNLNMPLDFPQIVTDLSKLELILVNLIHNAIKFTPINGQITFGSQIVEDQVKISINNTGGITIPREEYDRIFERFYQIEPSLTREHGGAGLGLAIVKGMVEVCGGEISVKSTETEGTTFTFTLPLDNSHLDEGQLIL